MTDFAEKLRRRELRSHVREDEVGTDLLTYLAERFARFDRDGWRNAIACGNVRLNGRNAAADATLARHDRVSYFPGDAAEPDADLRFRIVYEDDDLLVIDKPANLCVHPTGPFFRHTLWHLVGSRYGEIYFVNRLDRETSGLLTAARNVRTAAAMDNRNCPVRKEYLALVFGEFTGTVRARGILEPDRGSGVAKKKRFRPAADADSRRPDYADTELRAERAVPPDMTLVRAIAHTGRQHQIRATLCSLGYPLVGDKLYGPDDRLFLKIRECALTPDDRAILRLDRQALHSALIEFRHPTTGETVHCESPCPFAP